MAGSPVDICNMALAWIKEGHIQDLGERSRAAEECKRFYDEAIRSALSSADWSFARTYSAGVLIANVTPKPGWSYAFQYPADCLKLRHIARPWTWGGPVKFEIARSSTTTGVTRAIMTNMAAPVFVYTGANVLVEEFPSEFVLAASYHLAAMIAMPLAGKLSLVDAMRKLAVQAAAEARTENLNEEPIEMQDRQPDWLLGRGQYLGLTRGAWLNGE